MQHPLCRGDLEVKVFYEGRRIGVGTVVTDRCFGVSQRRRRDAADPLAILIAGNNAALVIGGDTDP